jgi:integrating conjugative element protein (TIGR03757 family)
MKYVMSFIRVSLLFVALSGEVLADNATPVFYFLTTNQYPIKNDTEAQRNGFELRVYNLDAHLNLEKKLSAGLPQNNIEEAERVANERLEKLDWQELQSAFQGMALASDWDIRKAPAFVFNEGKYVVYGVTDAGEALKRWLDYQSRLARSSPARGVK